MKIIFGFEELRSASLIKGAIYESGNFPISLRNDPLTELFRIDGFTRGIGNRSGFRKSNQERAGKSLKDNAFVIIKDSQAQSEWPNKYMKDKEEFIYFGDNREPGNHYLNTKQKGNEFLEKVFRLAYGSTNDRKQIPPIFVFRSTKQKADVEFLGLAVPGRKGKTLEETLRLHTFGEGDASYENYIAHFTILGTEEINRFWLRDLKDADSDKLMNAPEEWLSFVMQGIDVLDEFAHDVNVISEYTHIPVIRENEAKYEVYVRKTQRIFRESLMNMDDACRLCRLSIPDLLVASHIRPWKASNEVQKTDPNNGLLLCALHDALFDKGYISFTDEGEIMISREVPQEDYEKLQLKEDMKIELTEGNLKYLNWHRDALFRK